MRFWSIFTRRPVFFSGNGSHNFFLICCEHQRSVRKDVMCMNGTGKRYFLVDAVRGAAIVNMVIFHFLYDVFIVYGKDPHWYGLKGIHIWQQAICQTFIFISGFVWVWGMEGNLRRGLRFHLFGCMISLVTLFAVPSQAIWFGILNFMGSAVLLMFPLHRALEGVSCFRGFILCLFCLFSAGRYSTVISGLGTWCGYGCRICCTP